VEQIFFFVQKHSWDAVFCLSRAIVLGILVSSEALLAKRKRVGFERHLILFGTFSILIAAEIFGLCLGLLGMDQGPGMPPPAVWVWYPILSTAGLLGVGFCFDYARVEDAARFEDALPAERIEGPAREARGSSRRTNGGQARHTEGGQARLLRKHGRRFFVAVGILFALGALLTQRLLTSLPSLSDICPTSKDHLGSAAYLLHGLQAAAMAALGWKAWRTRGVRLTQSESRVFVLGAAFGILGAVGQIFAGPREPYTTLAFTFFVAVLLRDDYHQSELEAVRASEDRTARMLLFHRITTRLKSTSELPRLYEITMESLLANLHAESGAIYVRMNRENELQPVRLQGPYPPPLRMPEAEAAGAEPMGALLARTPIPAGAGVIGGVAATGIPVYVADPQEAAACYLWPTGAVRVRTTIALPLRDPEGIFGVIQVVNRRDGEPFSEHDLRFMSLIAEQAGLSIYNARLQGEAIQRQRAEEQMKVAREIQLRLIPSELPRIAGISLGAEYLAAEEVGGDYFDFCRIDHDHFGVVIFDVAGRGVPGALLMAITSTFFKMAAPRSNSPAWVLNEVNAALNAEMRHGLYVTALYGVLKLSTLQFTFVCAGHTDAIVVRDSPVGAPAPSSETRSPSSASGANDGPAPRGSPASAFVPLFGTAADKAADKPAGGEEQGRREDARRGGQAGCERHKPRGAALGLLRPNRFRAVMEQETVQLREGDTLLLYTDGVVEAVNEMGEQFGEDRLCDLARACARDGPRKLASEIKEAVRRYSGGQPEDDLTVVALRVAPEPEPAARGAGSSPEAGPKTEEGAR